MQRCAVLICAITLGILLNGCFPDKTEGYKAVYDRKGELVPHDPGARTYEPAPDPRSTTLVPAKARPPKDAKETTPPEEEKPAEEDKEQRPKPPEVYFGIPLYPEASYAEGHEGMTTSPNMKQVFLETFDIPEMVDSFYITKLPLDSRKIEKTSQGKTYIYTFPVLGQEIRTLQIMRLGKKTQIILTSLQDPTLGGITTSEPPRLPPTERPQPPSTARPLTPLPAMPQTPTKGSPTRP